jgi:radical SAM protein with 4Fe4S-binding SPASM domain
MTTQDLPYDKALLLLDILTDFGIKEIDIMGGEPFLLPWIVDFIHAGLAKDMSLNISTNGSMPAELELLRGLSHEQFNIGISLEGSTAEKHNRLTGSKNFASAFESIKKLVDFSLDPIVKTILCHDTAKDIQNIVNLLRGIGVRRYYIIHMDILSKEAIVMKNAIDYATFLGFYQKIKIKYPDIAVHSVNASCFDSNSLPPGVRCAGGTRKLSVMPDGAVFPCNLFHGFKGFRLGNIFRDSFKDIWSNQRLDFFRSHRENSCSIYACKNHASCTGGCPAHGFYHSGNPQATDIRCLQSKF